MKVDSLQKEFINKYDENAMKFIDRLSKNKSFTFNKNSIKAFNLKESMDDFQKVLDGFSTYKIQSMKENNSVSNEVILNKMETSINKDFFHESKLLYSDFSSFIGTYLNSIIEMVETTNNVKSSMMEAGVDQDSIAVVNEITDMFIDRLQESFNPVMESILWASGYKSHQILFNNKTTVKPVFL